MGARVVALSAGFANGSRKRKGDEFTLPDGVKPGKWLQVLEVEAPALTAKEIEAQQKAVAAERKAKQDAEAEAKNAELRGLAPKGGGKGKPAEDLA